MTPQICHHKPITLTYILATLSISLLDHLLRLSKSRIMNARIQPLPELNTTRLEIPRLNNGWRAGQHVRLRVLSTGMGWFGWAEAHPFTIATAGGSGEDGLVLL